MRCGRCKLASIALGAALLQACGARSDVLLRGEVDETNDAGADARVPVEDEPRTRPDASTDPPDEPRAGAAWRMLGADPQHSGRNGSAPSSRPEAVWTTVIGVNEETRPLVDRFGVVYAVGASAVHALSPSGAVLWSKAASSWISDAALSSDDRLVVLDGANFLVLDENGEPVVVSSLLPEEDAWNASLVVGSGDIAYALTNSPEQARLHAVDLEGRVIWTTPVGDDGEGELAQSPDGSLYVSLSTYGLSLPSHLARVTVDGELLWRVDFPEMLRVASIAPSGRVFVAAADLEYDYAAPITLYEVFPDGSFRKIKRTMVMSPPVTIGLDETLYLPIAGGVIAITADGEEIWQVEGDAPGLTRLHVWAPLALAGDGTVIASDLDSTLFGLENGEVSWSVPLGAMPHASRSPHFALGPDGTIVVGRWGGVVAAIR